ncbi:MAG: DUF983 domain-containing protein [Pirellulales bacterium]
MGLSAIARLRCPRCGVGRVYQRGLRMHAACPHCGLPLHREPGFYLGAMYFSYALAILAALPLCVYLFFLGVAPGWNALAGAAVIALLCPFLIRYSRVMWLHLDQRFDPQ